MNYKELERDILLFLSERSEREYTTTQVASFLGLRKEHRIDVQAILNKMVGDGKVKKEGKRYSSKEGSRGDFQSSNKGSKLKTLHRRQFWNDVNVESSEIDVTSKTSTLRTKTYIGQFDATSLAKNYSYAYVICDEGKDILVSTEDTLNAYHGDTVEVEVTRSRNDKRYGIIQRIIKRHKEKFVGIIETVRNKMYFRSDNMKIHTLFGVMDFQQVTDMAHRESLENLQKEMNLKVIVEVINWGIRQRNKLPLCRILEVLGEAGNPEIEIMSVIREFDLPLEFPEEVLEEANSISEEISEKEIKRRKDLRGLYTITIDPVSAKDFDDAISLIETENGDLHLYVHIADVGHYIKIGSQLFKEAVNRGNSYYFPKKVIPMLPERLSNKLCSLRPDEDKYAITVLSVFNKYGELQNQEIFESVIRSDFRLAYEEVDVYFETPHNRRVDVQSSCRDAACHVRSNDVQSFKDIFSPKLCAALDVMRKLSGYLSLSRNQRGYLKFDLPEVEYVYDDEGYIKDIIRTKETESHLVIENFMLIANEFVAKLLTNRAKETMYRIHEEPDEKDLNKITEMLKTYHINYTIDKNLNKTWQNLLECLPDDKYHRVFDRLILRSMKKAKYSTNHTQHFGLGLQTYTHFTSPIRRLCDLVVHLQLKSVVFKQPFTVGISKEGVGGGKNKSFRMFEWAGIATEREVIADESERMLETKIVSTFMKKKIGQQFKAIIINLSQNSIFVELNTIPVRGVIKLNQLHGDYYEFDEKKYLIKGKRKGMIFKLCDEIDVQIMSVNEEVVFDIVSVYKKKGQK